MGNNEMYSWWKSRCCSKVEEKIIDGDSVSYTCDCSYEAGMIVKLPIGEENITEVQIDSIPAKYQTKYEFGINWIYVIVPEGHHDLQLKF